LEACRIPSETGLLIPADKFKKVAANSFILQGGVEPLSSAPAWAEPSQLLIGMWLSALGIVLPHNGMVRRGFLEVVEFEEGGIP